MTIDLCNKDVLYDDYGKVVDSYRNYTNHLIMIENLLCSLKMQYIMRLYITFEKKDDTFDCRLPSYKLRYNHTITLTKKLCVSSHAIYQKSISISYITTCS